MIKSSELVGSGCEGKILHISLFQEITKKKVLADTLTKQNLNFFAYSCVSEYLPPTPLTDMSAKNVSFFDGSLKNVNHPPPYRELKIFFNKKIKIYFCG